jgi:cytochrome c-type biogenesis protein CcmH
MLILVIAALLLALLAVTYMAWPLYFAEKSRPGRAAHEIALLKRQLAEIGRDEDRETLSAQEAADARREISRKILAADAALAEEAEITSAPKAVSRKFAVGVGGAVIIGASVAYALIGAPRQPGSPLYARDIDAERIALLPSQADAEAAYGEKNSAPIEEEAAAVIARMRQVLAERPNDVQGRLLLAEAIRRHARHAEAWPLIEDAIAILGENASPELWVSLGESMALAANGYVSREAAVAFGKAPERPASRYFSAIAAAQIGEAERAVAIFADLLLHARRSDARDPQFETHLENQLQRAAQDAQIDGAAIIARLRLMAPPKPEEAPGPSAEDVAKAAASGL